MSPKLTPEQEKVFRDKGYLVVQDILSAEQCGTAIEKARRLRKPSDSQTLTQPHREEAHFLKLMQNRKITEPMESIIGPPIVGLTTHFFFFPQGATGLMKHQDNYCVEAPDALFATCWIPLVDVNDNNGCLVIYPGTHKSGPLDVRPLGKSGIREIFPNLLEEAILPEGAAPPINLHLGRGTGVFLDGALVHESLPNHTPENRYAFVASYLRKDAPFRAGNTAKREKVNLGFS